MKTIAEFNEQIQQTKSKVLDFESKFTLVTPLLDGLLTNHFFIYPADNLIVASVKTREEFAKLRPLVTGVWKKEVSVYSKPIVTYRATADCGIQVVVEVDELPPSCQLVEVVENVPAVKAQPATQKIVRKVICKDSSKVTAEEAKELAL
jgi:hypothetical protein